MITKEYKNRIFIDKQKLDIFENLFYNHLSIYSRGCQNPVKFGKLVGK